MPVHLSVSYLSEPVITVKRRKEKKRNGHACRLLSRAGLHFHFHFTLKRVDKLEQELLLLNCCCISARHLHSDISVEVQNPRVQPRQRRRRTRRAGWHTSPAKHAMHFHFPDPFKGANKKRVIKKFPKPCRAQTAVLFPHSSLVTW